EFCPPSLSCIKLVKAAGCLPRFFLYVHLFHTPCSLVCSSTAAPLVLALFGLPPLVPSFRCSISMISSP
uniref:Uncharacterized protein n=1 Tax=Oryza brachyantha TaxID=4533 RepID=J3KX73_ORYBR